MFSKIFPKHLIEWFLYSLVILVAVLAFKNNSYQNATGYYLSAATEFTLGEPITFSNSEVDKFHTLGDTEASVYTREKGGFYFKSKHDILIDREMEAQIGTTISYGYIYLIKISKKLFFYLGDLNSVIAMNILIHLFASIFLIKQFSNIWLRIGLLLIYGANPLIVHLATYGFYYYSQVISSISILFLLKKYNKKNLLIAIAIFFIICSVFIRPTLLFVLFFVLVYLLIRDKNKIYLWTTVLSTIIIVIMKLTIASNYSPWYTAYVGIGAYENDYGIELTDQSAEDLLQSYQTKNIKMSSDLENNILKVKYLSILANEPFLAIENASKNLFELFGFGYRTGNIFITNISIFLGITTLLFFLKFKLYHLLAAILFQNISYIFYYPPIPAYMAGSYIILIFGWFSIFSILINKNNFRELH